MKLFGGAGRHTVLVCDRYSAYKKLARIPGGLVTLAWCWSHHARRDYILLRRGRGAADAVVREMDRANRLALPPERGAPGPLRPGVLERQGAAFANAAQAALEKALDRPVRARPHGN